MKKLMSLVFVVLFLAASSTFAQNIQSGDFAADYNSADYALHQNKGTRSYDIDVTFKKPFEQVPAIVLTTTMIDSDNRFNTRFKVEAKSVSRDGFTIKISAWSDSKLWGIAGNWIALDK